MGEKREELLDYIENQRSADGRSIAKAISLTEIEVIDLLSEGPIEGLVTGEYELHGEVDSLGYDSVDVKLFDHAPNTVVNYLRSIYWNEVPIVDANNKYNYQRVDLSFTPGYPLGIDASPITSETTVTRVINERLRASQGIRSDGSVENEIDDYSKIYRIFNTQCNGAIINVKIQQLGETETDTSKTIETTSSDDAAFGETKPSEVSYAIYYRPLYSNPTIAVASPYRLAAIETLKGKITYGFIKSNRINFTDIPSSVESDFIGWEIKIVRSTKDSYTSYVRNQTYIDSITEIYGDKLSHPHSALVRARFSAEFFNQVPDRAFDARLLKVKVPNNYNPILHCYGDSNAISPNNKYDKVPEGTDFWDGGWHLDEDGNIKKLWSDNPAWCFYDLLTNKRYGLGKYVDEQYIDKWSLYEIAKYCDVLVPDGYGGIEPRFACNVLLNSRDDAFKVVNDMASIFNGIAYYGHGLIYSTQDRPVTDALVLFTNANVKDGDFQYSSSSKRARHTVAVVRYNDKTDLYKPAIEYVEDLNGIRQFGLRELDLTAFGCTSRGQAIRLGKWALLTESKQPETITFTAGFEASYLRPGDVFKVFDQHKKMGRFGGRLYDITDDGQHTTVTLDSAINSGLWVTGKPYSMAILTPSYNYDASLVDDLDSLDVDHIRKSFVQSGIFTGIWNTYNDANDRTIVTFNDQLLDTTNYDVNKLAIWLVEPISGFLDTSEIEKIVDPTTDYYRVINIEEKDNNEFRIAGLVYAAQKYAEIESNLSFEAPAAQYRTPSFSTASVSSLVMIPRVDAHATYIDYLFANDNYSGITNYHVFADHDSNFTYEGTGIPYPTKLIEVLPLTTQFYTYSPIETGSYYFRIYGYNKHSKLYSTNYLTGSTVVYENKPILNYVIGGLAVSNQGAGYIYVSGTGGSGDFKSTGLFSGSAPSFEWQIGQTGYLSQMAMIANRITIRAPSTDNIPSTTIYHEVTGLRNIHETSQFVLDLNTNIALSGGPYREFDIVIEAVDQKLQTSAGNQLTRSGLNNTEVWTNTYGYDIIHVKNERPPSLLLPSLSGYESGITTGLPYVMQQWFDPNGAVYLKIISGDLPPDTVGGYFYVSTGLFSGENITGHYTGWGITGGGLTGIWYSGITGEYPIYTGEFDWIIRNKYAVSHGLLFNVPTGYMAVAFYDEFDYALQNKGLNILTGLNVSNVVPIVPSGNTHHFDITNKLHIHNPSQLQEVTTFITTRVNYSGDTDASGTFWVSKAIDTDGIEYIIASKSLV